MGKIPSRRFKGPFKSVIAKAQSMQPQFETDLPRFTDFNPWFTETENTRLQVEIAAVIRDFSESSHTAKIEIQTETIAQLLTESGKKYHKLIYYVESGLGNTKAMNDTFGRSRYKKARQSKKEMISLLNHAVTAIGQENYLTALTASGMPPTLPDELTRMATDLSTADGKHEMLKKQRLLVTSQRIELFNSIWDKLSRISSASKILFADDPARLAIYRLYDGKRRNPKEPENPE